MFEAVFLRGCCTFGNGLALWLILVFSKIGVKEPPDNSLIIPPAYQRLSKLGVCWRSLAVGLAA